MKLKKLWISEYKNLKDFELKFDSDLITLLVGRNGLGKSNLIEILALIFRDLDLFEKEEYLENWPYEAGHFEFGIWYECKNSDLHIECKEGSFKVHRRQNGLVQDGDSELISFSEFKRKRKEEYLPDFIIGYYSGENKRIREIIRPYEELDWMNLKNRKGREKEFRQMFFAENHHSILVLLTVLLYRFEPPSDDFKERLNRLIKEFTSFASLERFRIHLKQPRRYRRGYGKNINRRSIDYIVNNLLPKKTKREVVKYPFWNTKNKADKIISFFYNNDLDEPNGYYDKTDKLEHLIIDLDKDKVATKVNKEFGHPANFLDALDSLHVIESLYDIELEVRSEKRDSNFQFSSLSEGEQQLITVLGLVLITGQKDCLFLLDEPDTHLNPKWQRQYVNLLKEFNLNDNNSHMIVATHSPLLVQEASECDIFLFKEGNEPGKIEVDTKITKMENWRIDHVLLSKYFNLESTRPKSLDEFMKERETILSKPKLDSEDLKRLEALENENGTLPTGESINDMQAMQLIRSIVNESQVNDQNS